MAGDKKAKKYSLQRNILRNLRYFWRTDKLSMLAYLGLASIQVTSSLLSIFFTSRIIGDLAQAITNQHVNATRLYWLLGGLGVNMFAEAFAWRWMNFVQRKSSIKSYVRNYVEYNEAVAKLDMPQHHDADTQKMLTKLYQGFAQTPSQFSFDTLNLIHATARMISTLAIVVNFAPWLFLVMMVALMPQFLVQKRLSKLQWGLWADKGDRWRLAWRTSHYLQDKDQLQETRAFGTAGFLLGRLNKLFSGFYNEQLANIRSVQVPVFGALMLDIGALIGVNFWLIKRVINHTLSLANFSFYAGIISQLGSALGLIVTSLSSLYDDNQFMMDLYKFYDTRPVLPVAERPKKVEPSAIPTIEFQNVSFRYPSSKNYALKNVSFVLKPDDKVAFVGENGAGKTTIIKLLLRFYDPNNGQILVNGIDIRELDLTSYYRHICALFQYFNHYPYSVRDNIALGRIDNFKNDQAVKAAAREAGADKFIEEYPLKYEQILEIGFKDGIEPSGGQWQRIALARALFRNAGILILDEPTASVDANAEYAIFKTLEQHSADRTTIIISHRFSTVRMAHKIYVMDRGKIIEQGSHAELLKIKDGRYKEMFEKQAEGYK